jgi:hypothetical protein
VGSTIQYRGKLGFRIIIPTEGVLVCKVPLYSPLGYEELTYPKWRALPWEKRPIETNKSQVLRCKLVLASSWILAGPLEWQCSKLHKAAGNPHNCPKD